MRIEHKRRPRVLQVRHGGTLSRSRWLAAGHHAPQEEAVEAVVGALPREQLERRENAAEEVAPRAVRRKSSMQYAVNFG